jgi:hypothetical protein
MNTLDCPAIIDRDASRKSGLGQRIMHHIIVDDEQAKLISEATDSVEIRDSRARHLGYVAHVFTDEDIAVAKARLAADEPRYTTREVLEQLQSLERK